MCLISVFETFSVKVEKCGSWILALEIIITMLESFKVGIRIFLQFDRYSIDVVAITESRDIDL